MFVPQASSDAPGTDSAVGVVKKTKDMTIAEIRGIEENRKDPAQQCVIHLMREGNFYHANDWSAWLMLNFPISKEPLTPTAKRLKDGYIHAFVGFPVTSLGKFVPDDVEFKAVTDTQIDVTTTADFGDATYEDLRSQVDAWKDGLPLNADKKGRREEREVAEAAPRVMRISDVMGRILSFPLESKSPIEAWEFLRQLRKQVVDMY